MPHDAKGQEIAVSDIVLMPFRVKKVHLSEDHCNVDLESLWGMPPDESKTSLQAVNTRQTIRANPGDNTDWRPSL